MASYLSIISQDDLFYFFQTFKFSTFHFFFAFSLTWTLWEPKWQNTTPLGNRFWIFSNFSWIFVSNILNKLLFRIYEILRSWISTIFFSFSLTWNHVAGKCKYLYSFHISRLFLNFCLQHAQKYFSDFWNFVFQILWNFWNLTWESMENDKMWGMLKTAGRRAKRVNIWDSQS